jgi:hypothetical protein
MKDRYAFGIFHIFQRWNKGLLFVSSLIFILIIGVIDYLTGTELSLSFFYLIPICISATVFSFWIVTGIGLFGVFIWLIAMLSGGKHYSNLFIMIWNGLMRLSIFEVIGLVVVQLRLALKQQEQLSNTDFRGFGLLCG